MADFRTTLERLSRGEVEFDYVARNIDKLLKKKPQAAVVVMDQLKRAVTDDVLDAETYARLKTRVAAHVEAAPSAALTPRVRNLPAKWTWTIARNLPAWAKRGQAHPTAPI